MSLIFSFQFHFVGEVVLSRYLISALEPGQRNLFDLLTKRRLTSKSFAVKLFEMLQAKRADRHTARQTQPIPAAATVYLKPSHVHPGRHMVFAEYEVERLWLPNGVIYNEEHSHYCRTSQKFQWPGLCSLWANIKHFLPHILGKRGLQPLAVIQAG